MSVEVSCLGPSPILMDPGSRTRDLDTNNEVSSSAVRDPRMATKVALMDLGLGV